QKFRDYLPETLEEAEELAASIERAVQQETAHGVYDLSVTIDEDSVVLKGCCDSFYCKQLAQHVAMCLSHADRLINGIEVL
ncbi:MAG: BON domain-containing protein, partial [Thermoguttaceae bacterium]